MHIKPRVVTLQVLHTNDVHGAIAPLPDRHIMGRKTELGGSAYLATLVDEKRAEHPDTTLLIDAGDAVHGQAETDLDEGRPMIEIMNEVGYDAGTLGNHDFQWGVGAMVDRMESANFPFLVANVTDDQGNGYPNSQAYKIWDMQGVRVGVLGLLTKSTESSQRADRLEHVRIEAEKQALERALTAMKSEGAEVVVVLTHCGLEGDEELARAFPDQNLFFVGGHSHDRIDEPRRVAGNTIVQAGSFGKELGALKITYDTGRKKAIGVEHSLIPIDPAEVKPDPEVAAIVEKYKAVAHRELGKVVTNLSQTLTRKGQHDSPMGNVVTDAMRWAASDVSGRPVDLAFMNSDGLRKQLDAGDVTLRDLYEMMPFGGELMLGQVSGASLKELLEHSVDTRTEDPEDWHAPFLQASGIEFHYDADRPQGDRVTSIQIDGKPLDPEASYSVALEDYLAKGALGFTPFARSQWEDMSMTINDAVRDYILEGHLEEIPAEASRIHDNTSREG